MKKKLCQQDKVLAIIILLVALVFFIVTPFVTGNANNKANEENYRIQNSIESYTGSYDVYYKAAEATHRLYLDYLVEKGDIKKLNADNVAEALLENAKDLREDQKNLFYDLLVTNAENEVYQFCNYYIADKDGHVYSNSKELIKIQKSKEKNYDTLLKESWLYSFKLNNKSEQEIFHSNVRNDYVDEESFNTTREDASYNLTDENGNSLIKWKPVSDMTFVIEIPSKILAQQISVYDLSMVTIDSIYHDVFKKEYAFFALVMFFIAFLLPTKKMQESKLIAFTSETLMSIALCFVQVFTIIFAVSIGTSLLYRVNINTPFSAILVIVALFILLIPTALLGIVVKKHFLKLAKKEGKEESHLYNGVLKTSLSIKNKFMKLTKINFNDNNKKSLIFIAVLNMFVVLLLVLFIMMGLQDFGIIIFLILILYSIAFYIILRKNMHKMQNDYQVLNDVIKDIIHAEDNVEIKQDLGVFEPMKGSLQNLQSDFKEAVEQEVQSQKMKTELITNVSHDLKTPLTSIISYIDLLKNEKLTKKEREKYIEVLDSSSNRLKHLIENLFEISKANSGNVSLDLMEVDIISLLKQAEVECETYLNKKSLTLRNQFADDKVMISLDSQKTYRIFENLLSNVGKYALENTRVYVKVEDFGNMVEVSIKNVSQDELDFDPDEIMERFTRGDKSRNTEGSGLGLAIAKSFTEIQNGMMKISIDGDLFKVNVRFYRALEEES